jgi:hypothetical protein
LGWQTKNSWSFLVSSTILSLSLSSLLGSSVLLLQMPGNCTCPKYQYNMAKNVGFEAWKMDTFKSLKFL